MLESWPRICKGLDSSVVPHMQQNRNIETDPFEIMSQKTELSNIILNFDSFNIFLANRLYYFLKFSSLFSFIENIIFSHTIYSDYSFSSTSSYFPSPFPSGSTPFLFLLRKEQVFKRQQQPNMAKIYNKMKQSSHTEAGHCNPTGRRVPRAITRIRI